MSKENIRKHTSIKNALSGLQRRQSRQDFKQLTSDHKMICTTQQSEVAKKIQNKLRMRKRSTNINGNDRTAHTPPEIPSNDNLSSQQGSDTQASRGFKGYDSTIDIPETVERVLDRDENISDKIILANINKQVIKQQLIRDSTFILCQLTKGRKIQQIIVQRVQTIIQTQKLKQRISQKQRSIMAMMDDRIKKLMQLQKPLVH